MQAQAPLPRESLIEQALPGADPMALQALARRTVVLPSQTLVNANTSDLSVLQAVTPAVEPARLQALLGERDAGHWLLNRGDIANRLQLSNEQMAVLPLGIHSEWFLAVGQVQADGSAVDFRALLWRQYRDDGARVQRCGRGSAHDRAASGAPAGAGGLRADSTVDWVQLHKGTVLAHGSDMLAALGLRHPQATVHACLDPNDLILLELQLPPLSGRRLQSALQGEVEAMLLDDLQEVTLAHGAQAADGTVAVAWLGQQPIVQLQQLLASCALQLQALYPTPLLLPWQPGQATLQVSGAHLLVRNGRDRGFVQWHGGRDACAVMQALAGRLQQAGCRPCNGSAACRRRGRTTCRPARSRLRSRPAGPCRVVIAVARREPPVAATGHRAGIGSRTAGRAGVAVAGRALAKRG